MDKDTKILAGLVGISVLGIGAIIGGTIISKIDKKFEDRSTKTWADLTEFFRKMYLKECKENEELKKELEAK